MLWRRLARRYNRRSSRTLDARDRLVSFADMTAIALRHSYILLLCFSLLGCSQEPGEPSQMGKVIEELRSLYDKALEQAPDDPVEWAKEDIARYGNWEYRVVMLDDMRVGELEDGLNQLGAERWEVFWMERTGGNLIVFLKRPTKSYLRSVPLSDLGKALSGAESDE